MAYSKKSKMKFFYNKITKESTYKMPPNSAAPFQYVLFFYLNYLLFYWLLGLVKLDGQ